MLKGGRESPENVLKTASIKCSTSSLGWVYRATLYVICKGDINNAYRMG